MPFDLDQVDVDGAVGEAAEQVAVHSRLAFLTKSALAVGAAGGVLSALAPASALAAGIGTPPATYGPGDTGILNYALVLEYLESAFYDAAAARHLARGDRMLSAYLEIAQRDEAAHVTLLKGALGSKAMARPKFDFGRALDGRHQFAETAYELENVGVHAYLGQLDNLTAAEHVRVAESIVTVEARHAGAIGLYLGRTIAPAPLDSRYPAAKVLGIVEPKFVVTHHG